MLAGLLALLLAAPAPAEELDSTAAFERGFALSLYQFDACGDPLAGRLFRRALAERFAACPFTAAARARFARRTAAEQAKARQIMTGLIEQNGGLPHQLDGMPTTCREHQGSQEYRRFRSRLEGYAAGEVSAEALLPAACDAADIMP